MKKFLLFLFFGIFSFMAFAQEFEASLQLRPRFEFRNGYKTLLNEHQDPASFVSQRSRLMLNYEDTPLRLKFSLQNIRVWGDVPTMTTADNNGIAVFEAYGDYFIAPELKVRVGRQVLSYDNQRIFGEVDWAQQGQSHDALLLTYLPATSQRLDLGFALNSNAENLVEIPYSVNNYKAMQFAWYHLEYGTSGLSFLVANTGFDSGIVGENRKTEYLQTFGSYFRFSKGSFSGDLGGYGQTGKRNSRTVEAFYAGANLNYKIDSNWIMGIGGEYVSGTDLNDNTGKNYSFTPLFGTNHAFNGFMDYFYVGNHQNSVGLVDGYAKLSYINGRLGMSAVPHIFYAEGEIIGSEGENDLFLGTEVDIMANYRIHKDVSLNLGYSQMFGTPSMEVLKGVDSSRVQNWAWIMLSFHPRLFQYNTTPKVP